MNLRLYNARLLMPDFSILTGELLIQDDCIYDIIPSKPSPGYFSDFSGTDGNLENSTFAGTLPVHPAATRAQAFSCDREMDLSGNLIIPGFKNAHTHSAMTFLRSYADDLPLQQ